MVVAEAPTARRVVPVETVHEYARDVVAGRVLAGPYVRLACERHLRDLEHGAERGLRFDDAKAAAALRFMALLNLDDDEPLRLEPFQAFIVGALFGWVRVEDGHRRFRRAYIEIGKGNGKTPMAAAIGLKGLCADGQTAAEVYSAATTRNQARILFDDAKRIVRATPDLEERLAVLMHNIGYRGCFMRPVSSEGRSLSGPRVHMALVDEVHEHPSDVVIEKLRAGTKRNLDALILEITNSGADRVSVCWEDHQYSVNVLDGVFEDDSWFAYVCALDEGDVWTDEAVWPKANPGLDTILPSVYLREQVREAVNKPAKANLVKRLNFCIWTEQLDRWLDMELWRASGEAEVDAAALAGQRCFGGLSMASRRDFAGFVMYFPDTRSVLPYFWIPEDMVTRTGQERLQIEQWAAAGLVTLTPGNVADIDLIREDIEVLKGRYQVEEFPFDSNNATELAIQLEKGGATTVSMQTNGSKMSEAAQVLEALVAGEELRHGGHPVLEWMASNVAVQIDRHGNIKLDRERSGDRIDGVTGLVLAIARAIVHNQEEPPKPRFYSFGDDR